MDRVEYLRRSLGPDTSPADLDELGREGWELCAIDRGVGWFKRSRVARQLERQGDEQRGVASPAAGPIEECGRP